VSSPGGHDITCRQAFDLVAGYLEGALGPRDLALFEAHLGECELCTEHFRQIRITMTVTGGLREEDVDPGVREDLMALYRRWRADRGA
jgi:predicted anti-sigma-YlaC factor YlaD